ncbi:MAG: aldo/keto reductase [Bacteroidales bacterium]|nr:aldo/keto reductase [Bacteroidales bacterium]
MKLKNLGKTDVKVTEITFGAWAIGGWMWGGADKKDALKALNESINVGMTTIDTAPVYGFGVSEEIVGAAIKGKRDKVQILTKYGMHWDKTQGEKFFSTVDNNNNPITIYKYAAKESIIKECELSLKRLKTDYIDLYQIHWPDSTTPIEETMEAVDLLITQGKVRAAGVCNYSKDQTQTAAETITTLASNQVPYSMVNRDIEKDVVPYCIENNIGILAYSPLQRGLLTGKITNDYKFNPGDNRPQTPHFKGENLKMINVFLDKLRPMAADKKATLSQLVIRWTLLQPGITVALVGARNPEQVKENAGAAHITITNEELQFINTELKKLKLIL